MRRDKPRKKLLERAAEYLDLPGELMGEARITITGCRRVTVENHRGLLAYDSNEAAINGGKLIVRIKGDGLNIRGMNREEVAVDGVITALDFDFLD